MRNTSFYDQEIEQVNQLVQKLYRGSPHTLDKEEFTGAVWLAYWEARTTYHLFEGCCDWDAICKPGWMKRWRPFAASGTAGCR